jgi:hypothetical protein
MHQREAEVISEKAADEIDRLLRQADTSNMRSWFLNNKADLLDIVGLAYHTNQSLAHLYLHGIADEADTYTNVYEKTFSLGWVWRSIAYVGWREFMADIAKGVPADLARERMIKRIHGAVFRHSYNGSRDTILQTVKRSNTMVGYQRVSLTGTPCSFCAMLIGRGAVYKANMGHFQAHDNDRCTAEPRFRNQLRQGIDPQVKKFSQLWEDATAGESGIDAINAFRRAYERGNE